MKNVTPNDPGDLNVRSHAITVTGYQHDWPRLFDELARPVREALAGLDARVEHVGGTSVPGLAAKPIVDLDVVVGSDAEVPAAIDRLRSLGYVHEGDLGIPGREAFMWPAGAPRHHLYLVVRGGRAHLDHVEFRDHLRQHPEVAAAYGALKVRLAARHGSDRAAYTAAKAQFVAGALARHRRRAPPRTAR
jgi:GrpB-like predicted nucleotidyltransferase (UPF0157 family)